MEKIKHELDLLPMVLRSASKLRSNGKGPLIMRVTINCDCEEVSLSANVTPENWIVTNKAVSKDEENYKKINQKIKSAEVDLSRIYDKLYLEYDEVTPLMIKRVYLGKPPFEPKKDPHELQFTLVTAFNEFIEKFEKLVKEKKRSKGTLRQWRSTRKKVIEFLRFNEHKNKRRKASPNDEGKVDILFPDISANFGDEIYDYMTIESSSTISDVTAKKHIKKLKQIIKIAVKKKIILYNPIADFVCGGDTNEVIPLEWTEVMAIYRKDLGIERLQEVADAYIFQIFTGFAYQDLYDLKPENIILVGPRKERWLCKHRGKTGVYEVVPMLPIVEELIDKYHDHPVCIARNSLLPVLSNTNYNGYLKEIGVICGINRELNTHLARHTFADIMLNMGMPLEDVAKMLGHKSIRTTQRYARVRKERIQKNFNKYVRPIINITKEMTHEISKDKEVLADNYSSSYYQYDDSFTSTKSSGFNYSFNYTEST